ncbi:hypothetical protein ACNJ7E_20925 [Rhodococcus sp. NM-2]|uniref:hypothetical protein n=1 Tax=Rhodococcus sp. NM-2 TaxID=3401174 RepID=UPI003AAC1D7F
MQVARDKVDEGQEELLGLYALAGPGGGPSVITAKRSRWLIDRGDRDRMAQVGVRCD